MKTKQIKQENVTNIFSKKKKNNVVNKFSKTNQHLVHYLVVVLFEIEESFKINLVISKRHNFWDIFHKSARTQTAINLGLYCWKSSFWNIFVRLFSVQAYPVPSTRWQKYLSVVRVRKKIYRCVTFFRYSQNPVFTF